MYQVMRIQVLMRIPSLYIVLCTWYTLELHLQPQQEISSCLRIEKVFRHQLSTSSAWHKVAEGVSIGLVQLIKEIVDQ